MSYYQTFNKNYWDRKVFNKNEDFDLRLLKDESVSKEDSEKSLKNM